MQCSLFFTSKLVIDSTMCCPPSCCSSQPLSGGWQTHEAESGWLPPQQQGAELGWCGGVCRVMGSTGTGALLSGGLQRTTSKKRKKGKKKTSLSSCVVCIAHFFFRGWIWPVDALSALYCTCKNKQEFGQRQVIRAQWSAQ